MVAEMPIPTRIKPQRSRMNSSMALDSSRRLAIASDAKPKQQER